MKLPETLKLNKEYKRAYYRGGYKAGPLLVTYCVRGKRPVRYGITAGKKVGNAVRRNRARRIIRAAFLQLWREQEFLGLGGDYVFVAREKTPDAKSTEIYAAMKYQVRALSKRQGSGNDGKAAQN